jgi:hypothetical protein
MDWLWLRRSCAIAVGRAFAQRVALLIAVWRLAHLPHNLLKVNVLQLVEVQRSLRKPFASNPDPRV